MRADETTLRPESGQQPRIIASQFEPGTEDFGGHVRHRLELDGDRGSLRCETHAGLTTMRRFGSSPSDSLTTPSTADTAS